MRLSVRASSRRARKKTRHYRCWLDGQDMTSRTFYADTRAGVVRLYRHNAKGRPFLNPSRTGVVEETRHGRVELRRMGR